jgi:hypothetical protein
MGTIVTATRMPDGSWRPFVPVALRYADHGHAEHDQLGVGLLDSGADLTMVPASQLPPDVAWDTLQATSVRVRGGLQADTFRVRLWQCEVSVVGVRIARQVFVPEPGHGPEYIVLALGDWGSRLSVAFAFANVPPIVIVQSAGQLTPAPMRVLASSTNRATRRRIAHGRAKRPVAAR